MFCWVLFWLLVWFSKSELARVKKRVKNDSLFLLVGWLLMWLNLGCFGGAGMRV